MATEDNIHTDAARPAAAVAGPGRARSWWPTLIVVGLFLIAAVPMIVTQHDRGRGRFDQINYHEPAVLRFAEQWPAPDVSDYLSATTPGYHLVLAAVARYFSDSLVVLQLVGSVFTVGLLTVLTRWLVGRVGPTTATVLGLSVACSLYVFSAGVYILPDNAAWMLVLGILLLSLRPRADAFFYLGGGGLLLLLILTRQSHLWALGMLLAAGWLGAAFRPASGGFGEIPGLFSGLGSRVGRALTVMLCALPALGVLAWFSRVWGGGLTVPIYQDYMRGPNPATPAIILAQLGVIGGFHLIFWWRNGLELIKARPGVLLAGVGAGLAILVGPVTVPDKDAGRYSGLWNLIEKAPDLAGHVNLGLFILGIGGIVAVAGWLSGMDARSRWVMLGSLCGFALAMSMPKNAWTRYHEPFLLMWSAVASGILVSRGGVRPDRERFLRTLGIMGLCAFLASISVLKLSRSDRVTEPKWSQKILERPLGSLWPEAWLERWGEGDRAPAGTPTGAAVGGPAHGSDD